MVWFKVDDPVRRHDGKIGKLYYLIDQLPDEQKAELLAASIDDLTALATIGVWALAGSFCGRELTDGHITDGQLRQATCADRNLLKVTADLLLKIELWDPAEDGHQFHDWTKYNPTAAQVKAKRSAERARQEKYRGKRRDSQGRYSLDGSPGGADPPGMSRRDTDRDTRRDYASGHTVPDPDPGFLKEPPPKPPVHGGRAPPGAGAASSWLEVTEPIGPERVADRIAAARALADEHNRLRKKIGLKKPTKFPAQGGVTDAVKAALAMYSPIELAAALDTCAHYAANVGPRSMLSSRFWIRAKDGRPEYPQWLETTPEEIDAERAGGGDGRAGVKAAKRRADAEYERQQAERKRRRGRDADEAWADVLVQATGSKPDPAEIFSPLARRIALELGWDALRSEPLAYQDRFLAMYLESSA